MPKLHYVRGWSQWQLDYLDSNYPYKRTEDVADVVGKTITAVMHMAHSRGVYKDKEALSKIMHVSNSGANSGNYNGYVSRKDGYVFRFVPDHPNANSRGYIGEHRLIVEKHLGFILPREFVVHHINGIKDDNRIENLAIMTFGAHSALHGKLGRNQPSGKQHYRYKEVDLAYAQRLRSEGYSVEKMCKTLGITKYTYYKRLREVEQCRN